MKTGVADAAKLRSLLKRVGSHEPVPSAGEGDAGYDDPIAVLVFSFLLWESTTQQAQFAMRKIIDATVDFNELRVSLPNEILAVIGSRYPRGLERAQRLKSSLHSIYLTRHSVSLDHLESVGKRDVRTFVERLNGIPPYVSARLLQRCFDVHTIPVDERLVELFVDKGVLKEVVDPNTVSKWLSRQVKSANVREVEASLRVFVDTAPKLTRKTAAKSTTDSAQKTTKKTTKKTSKPPSKAAKTTTKKSAKKTARKTARKTAKKVAKKSRSKVTKKTSRKTTAGKKTSKKKKIRRR